MSGQSQSFPFRVLFESALQNYQDQTGTTLASHPLAEQLQACDSIESVTALLQEQAQAFGESRGNDGRIMASLKRVVSILYALSANTVLGDAIGLPFPPAKAIFAGFAILLAAVKDVGSSHQALIDLLELIEHFINRLEIYSRVPPTGALAEIVVKIMVELLSTLALVTKQVKQKRPIKFLKKLLGENDVNAELLKLDRLTQYEARTAFAQTLEVVYGLMRNMRVIMDDGKVSAEIMQQIASDMHGSERNQLRQDIQSWLSPPDPWKNHSIACESRQTGTTAWFVHDERFSDWKLSGPSSLLWIHGKPGAGKSVLCSTIVQNVDAMRKSGLALLAFFYCDFREDQKKDRRGLLSSLLVQLCRQSDSYCDILSNFHAEHARGSQCPSDDALAQCLKDMLNLPQQPPIYLIVDALDECPSASSMPSPREKVLMFVKGLIDLQVQNLHICVTSRPETDVKAVLEPLTFCSISLHDESGQLDDIDNYIKWAVTTDLRMQRWKAEDKQLVIEALTRNADGMFRWAYCQIVHLRDCLPGCIRHALAELPETLDETYQRALREIKQANWEFAHRLFQCVSVASRPLRVEELAEFLAFDFKAGPIPKFHEDWHLDDPVDAVLSTCSSLLAIVTIKDSRIIQFSHFSVKEFLTSTRLEEASDTLSRRYHVSMTAAHTLIAQTCLGMLLHLDKNITNYGLQKFPLIEYAAQYWVGHAQFENVSRNMQVGIRHIFNPRNPHLAIWVWIYDPHPRSRRGRRGLRDERPSHPIRTSLHYAAICGFHTVVKFLAIEHALDVTAQDEPGSTSLHHASFRGHIEVARVLLELGASTTARDDQGCTPLHEASYWGHVEVALLLLEYGADATTRSKSGYTPLHMASLGGRMEVVCVLLDRGADATAQAEYRLTPLHEASFWGHTGIVRILLEHGANATAQEKSGWTPLHDASVRGRDEIALLLLEHGADPTIPTTNGRTPLHMASSEGRLQVACVLLEHGANTTAQAKNGSTPLHLASLNGHVEVVRVLLEHGADVTAQDKTGWTPLHLALSRGHVEVARTLLQHNADATKQSKGGWTPLHSASRGGSVEAVLFLLENDTDPTALSKDGSTPLHSASYGGHIGCAFILLERRANVTARSQGGLTPLHLASRQGHVRVTLLLLERGADATVQSDRGTTPLHLSSARQHVEVTLILLEHDADMTVRDKRGSTPLHLASRGGHIDIVRILLERGVDTTAQDEHGWTPLHLASRGGHVETTRILLEQGANAMAQDRQGWTPLHWASRGGHAGVAHILLQYGADPGAHNSMNRTPLEEATGVYRRIKQLLSSHGAFL